MKHAKRTRAESIAGKVNNQTQNQAAEFQRQARLVMESFGNALEAHKDADLSRDWLLNLMVQVSCLVKMGMALPGKAAASAKPEFKAHSDLENACQQAADLLSLLADKLCLYMDDADAYPGGGAGVIGLGVDAGKKLMKCFQAAWDEHKESGGKPGPLAGGTATLLN